MKRIYSIYIVLLLIGLNACQDKNLPNLDKWISINETLDNGLIRKVKSNEDISYRLEVMAGRYGNPEEGKAIIINRAKDVLTHTKKVIDTLDYLKRRLIAEVGQGKESKTGLINRPNKVVGNYYLEGLPDYLDDYVDYLNKECKDLVKEEFEKLTKTKTDKDFLQENFDGEPLIVVLALISEKQLEIKQYEQLVLESLILASIYPSKVFKTNILAYVLADADAIAEDQPYQANILHRAYFMNPEFKMTCNGKEISNENGIGKIQLKAEKLGEQIYEVAISFKINGRDTTFTSSSSYFVLPK